MATVSARRLCISTTSMPLSRILLTKSKWSRLALSTHSTSSNRRRSQLVGVSRWCARPGAHTITLRSVPTSEWTPNLPSDAVAMSHSRSLDGDVAGDQPPDAHDRTDGREDEDDPVRRPREHRQALLAPGPDVQRGSRRVEHS